jgi:putative Holliday junction resolvase
LQIADQEHVAEIVVGMPKSLSFENTLARDSALGFISLLQNRTQIKISGYDERFTTVIASKKLRDSGHDSRTMKSKIDAMAAAEILQQYLDSRGSI